MPIISERHVPARRKMRDHDASHGIDPADDGADKVAGPQLCLYFLADALPLRQLRVVHGTIDNDFNGAICEQQVDQHPVSVLGVPQVKGCEDLNGALARALTAHQTQAVECPLHREADLPRVLTLARCYGFPDGKQRGGREGRVLPPARHKQVPENSPDRHLTSVPRRRRHRNHHRPLNNLRRLLSRIPLQGRRRSRHRMSR